MPRKLKTFVTESGFFELAVAAPSMKQALKDWGIEINLFQQGLARQTDDAAVIKAAEAAPGKVLRRPIGTKEPFREGAELPQVKGAARKSKAKPDRHARRASGPDRRAGTVDLHAIRQARAALEAAQAQHRKTIEALNKERDAVERRAEREEANWRQEKERLEAAIERLKR